MIPIYGLLRQSAAVVAIVGTRIYRAWAGNAPGEPYIVWRVVAAPPDNHVSGRPPSDRYSVTIDCFAPSEAQSDALVTAARDALEAHGQMSSGPQDLGRDPDTELWRWQFTIDIHLNR